MTNVTDLLDLDINDGEDTFPDLDPSNKGSSNDLLQTPSPISKNDPLPATQQSPTAFLTEVLQMTKIAKKIQHSTPPETRVRIDVFVSLRNNGQKVDTIKMPKMCITQFSLNQSPNAFRNTEFYKAIVKDARAHLALAAPFPAYTQSPTKTEGTNHDLNKRTTLLIKEAERITDLLAVNTVQAKLDWIALLYQYQQLRAPGETIPIMEEPITELPNQPTDVGIIQPTVIMDEKTGKEKPNLQIQITHHGDRAVSHTPDTTGTPATTPSPIIPPYISTAPTNPALIHVDPNLLLEFVLQRQQQQKDTTTATIEQKIGI
jgi:hypothetical protein